MPKPIVFGKFELDPAYDESKDLANTIESARRFFEKELACVDTIDDITLQLICMFAMIDRLAQEEANYPHDSKSAFCQFVLKHQKQCDYLDSIEPVTLFYRVEDDIDEVVFLPDSPPEKEVSLDSLGYLHATKVKDVLPKDKSKEILEYIAKKKGIPFAEKMKKEHRLISLLYRMRSKAVHEMSGLGETLKYAGRDIKETEPFYRSVGRGYVLDGDVVSDDVVELVIPNAFIRNILADCINGYLEDCSTNKRFPFSNNHITRKYKLSWYDK